MRRGSRSPDDSMVAGKVVVENLPRRPVATNDVHNWLKKYGNISEILIYKDCLLVQFDSDLEAAGAVQCEDGAQFFGSIVSVKHVEPSTLSSLRRSGPPVDRYLAGGRRFQPAGSRDRDRDRDSDRDRARERDRDRGRTRERDVSPRGRYHDGSSYDRRRRREDLSPRKRSRSPLGQRGDRRHVHPLNWLSEVAGGDTTGPVNGSAAAAPKALSSTATTARTPPPYTVAIVAVQHDLVPYAETIEKRVSTGIRIPENRDPSSLRTHIVVLLSADHLTPCLADLTRDRVPFAIICTTTNWTHGSCTLRILYVPTQQEHRNMPLDDAMLLLQKEYDTYLATENEAPAMVPLSSEPTPMADPEDHTFLAPSRNMVTLLRMLADSRILSIGELDEISAFVQERKRRLEGRRLDTSADGHNGSTTDLKSRILNMLYPQTPVSSTPTNALTGIGSFQTLPNSTVTPQPQMNPSNVQQVPPGMANPVVQQAIDTLMMLPSDRFSQQQPSMQQQSVGSQQNANVDVLGGRSSGGYPKGPTSGSMDRGAGAMGNRPPYGSEPNKFGSGRMDRSGSGMDDERAKFGQPQKLTDYSNLESKSGQGFGPQRYSTYKQPYGEVPKGQTPVGQQKKEPVRAGSGSAQKFGSRGSDEGVPGHQAIPRDDEGSAPHWRGRKRGKRGGGAGRGGLSDGRQSYPSPDQKGQRQAQQPHDLMATEVAPVGSLADSYRQPDPYKYAYAGRPGQVPAGPAAAYPGMAPYYMQHVPGYPYAGQPYY
ncbi:Nuclear receptor coactivator 5 [Clonorchis sinensis]|uniref:Nuclear receptor coactivator 5 n=1 Tax=Clonorchis sinensis TaxID=79923 RepID=A0A8T1N0H8_CLOSI|nr:Nuclear receptor coactivator 5 [Clonorchis sinensis]